MTMEEFLRRMLERHGYDGLFNPDTGCNCTLEELLICGRPYPYCEPGVLVVCDCEDHDGYHFEPKRVDVSESEKMFYYSQTPLSHVDATPDEGYPLRILRTYLENSRTVLMTKGGSSELIDKMNEANKKREEILEKAIKVLERFYLSQNNEQEGEMDFAAEAAQSLLGEKK